MNQSNGKKSTTVPIFCSVKSRDEARKILCEQFPDAELQIKTPFAGPTGIEIIAPVEEINAIMDYITEHFSDSLTEFLSAA